MRTGVAVRAGDAMPAIGERAQLAAALRSAPAVYVPDTLRSTAGIHVVNVLRAPRHRRRGRAAVVDSSERRDRDARARRGERAGAIGCTQITEIHYTPGIVLVGPLPAEFELATVYSVAVCAAAQDPALARRFAAMVAGPDNRSLRESAGFGANEGGIPERNRGGREAAACVSVARAACRMEQVRVVGEGPPSNPVERRSTRASSSAAPQATNSGSKCSSDGCARVASGAWSR